jgi:hypothetical protein
MADRSLEERVAILERAMGGTSFVEHFCEHAELAFIRRDLGLILKKLAVAS